MERNEEQMLKDFVNDWCVRVCGVLAAAAFAVMTTTIVMLDLPVAWPLG